MDVGVGLTDVGFGSTDEKWKSNKVDDLSEIHSIILSKRVSNGVDGRILSTKLQIPNSSMQVATTTSDFGHPISSVKFQIPVSE